MDTRLPVYADANPPPDDDDDPPPPIAAHIITIPGDQVEAAFIELLLGLGARFVDVTPDGDEEA